MACFGGPLSFWVSGRGVKDSGAWVVHVYRKALSILSQERERERDRERERQRQRQSERERARKKDKHTYVYILLKLIGRTLDDNKYGAQTLSLKP